jgi:hypothetical protein
LEYVTLAATQKNLSGTDFHDSPEGVRRMDAPNNLGQKNAGSVFSRKPPGMEVNRMDAMSKRQARLNSYIFSWPLNPPAPYFLKEEINGYIQL